jgi:hypothetical protein
MGLILAGGPVRILLAQEQDPIALGTSGPQPPELSTKRTAVHRRVFSSFFPFRSYRARYSLVRCRGDHSATHIATAPIDRVNDCPQVPLSTS